MYISLYQIFFINKKYLIKTKYSKIIIFMRGGILSFSKIFFFYFCNILKIGKIGAIISNFAVLRCKLNGHYRKNPDIFFKYFFLQKLLS